MREELYQVLMEEHCPSTYFYKLRSKGDLAESYPEIAMLIGVRQDPQHHPEGDVYTHTMMVVDYAARIRNQAEYPLPFMLSALCHDFGKPAATSVDENGKIHAYGHDEAGVDIACRFLRRIRADVETEIYVANMVSLHMLPARKAKRGSSLKSTNHMFDGSVSPHDLLLLSEADQMGRGGAVMDKERREWLSDRLSAYDEMMARPYVSREMLEKSGNWDEQAMDEMLHLSHKLRLAGVDAEDALQQVLGVGRKIMRKYN